MMIEKRWIISFTLIVAVALFALSWEFVAPAAEAVADTSANIIGSDVAWMLTASCLVLLMTPGLSFFYGGMVGSKSVISTMLQSVICLGVISILWVVVGFSLAFGDDLGGMGIIGDPGTFFMFKNVGAMPHSMMATSIPFILFAMFQLKFAIITPALITGSFAERVRFIAYLLFVCLFSLLIYAPLCHMVWHPEGLLLVKFHVLDFAGGTVVHMSAGFAALAGAVVLGKRQKKEHIAANIPFVLLGTGLLWFGWFGFNAGSAAAANGTAAMAFATTNTASAIAMLTWIFFDRINGRKVSALGACIGAVVGLVAITPACAFVTIPQAIFIGFIAAIISNMMVNWKALKKVDDTLDVFACHGVGGMVGMICTAIFAGGGKGLIYGGTEDFGLAIIALILVAAFAFFGSFILYKLTNMIIPLRVTEESEQIGLDISQHGESMTPEA
ncbi:MAG: ammonium transporter [Bacteroidetes bacterium]|nr:ammonium transporter [Bacteroidota bacterium]